jgi:undecaprenyl diphosphate synthase
MPTSDDAGREIGRGRETAREEERPASARHVAIIADGNRRWARARGEPVQQGHAAGADTLKARLRDAVELGIEELTVYSFSTENWSRPAEEVKRLVAMLAERIAAETPELHAQGVRMRFLGAREGVSPRLLREMDRAESITGANRRMTLFVAFNYGGRAEIIDAARRFTGSTEAEFRALLYAPDMHDPEVIIRTGGERRLSNYLLWQSAYAELVFRDELWPDFTSAVLEQSLRELDERKRRCGGRVPHHDGVDGVTTVPGRGREG